MKYLVKSINKNIFAISDDDSCCRSFCWGKLCSPKRKPIC